VDASPDHRDQTGLGNDLILGDQGGAKGEGGGGNEAVKGSAVVFQDAGSIALSPKPSLPP
jgi:hypothetical protein